MAGRQWMWGRRDKKRTTRSQMRSRHSLLKGCRTGDTEMLYRRSMPLAGRLFRNESKWDGEVAYRHTTFSSSRPVGSLRDRVSAWKPNGKVPDLFGIGATSPGGHSGTANPARRGVSKPGQQPRGAWRQVPIPELPSQPFPPVGGHEGIYNSTGKPLSSRAGSKP